MGVLVLGCRGCLGAGVDSDGVDPFGKDVMPKSQTNIPSMKSCSRCLSTGTRS